MGSYLQTGGSGGGGGGGGGGSGQVQLLPGNNNAGDFDVASIAAGANIIGKIGLVQAGVDISDAAPLSVRSGRAIQVVRASFTRPANTIVYSNSDLVGIDTAVNAGNAIAVPNGVTANGDAFRVEICKFQKSNLSLLNAQFRVNVWRSQPSFPSVGDNVLQGDISQLICADIGDHVGFFDFVMDRASTVQGAYGYATPSVGGAILVDPATGTTFWYSVQARAGYLPVSGEVFTASFGGIKA